MGHLAIVNSDTILGITNQHPYISIGGTLNNLPYKTISDLFADALTIRDGDIIFTWMIDGGSVPGIGFDRYYIANGAVVFDSADPQFPIKVGVKDGYGYNNALPEEKALDIFGPQLLWNAIGKKSLRRGRSLSHQTLDEDKQLLSLLSRANAGTGPTRLITAPAYNNTYTPISINNFGPGTNPQIAPRSPLNTILVNNIIWNSGDSFLYEKTLEAYLCENIDSNAISFCSILGYPNHHIKWLGNYLPYGVAGKNIDLVCELEGGNVPVVIVIELKNGPANYNVYRQIINRQLNAYTQFIGNAYRSYRGNRFAIEQVVLTHSPNRRLAPGLAQHNNTKWIGYQIDPKNYSVLFSRLL